MASGLSRGRASPAEPTSAAMELPMMPDELQGMIGEALGVASLTSLPPGLPSPGEARLWLPPELLFALELPAGALAMVGLVGTGPGHRNLAPLSLRHLFLQRLGVAAGSGDDAGGGSAAPRLGDFMVAAALWPAARLAKGTAAASPVLRDALGRPGAGAQLALYALPPQPGPAAAAAAGASAAGVEQGQPPECSAVCLRLCTLQGSFAGTPAVLPPLGSDDAAEEAGGTAGGSGGSGSQQRGAGPPASPAMRGGGGGTPVALSPAMRGGGRQPVALSPAMRGGAGGGTPVGLLNSGSRGSQQQQPPSTPHTPKAGGPGSVASGSGAARDSMRPDPRQGAALLALLQDQGAQRPRLRALLEGLLLRQLCGRRLLPGNLVAAPVLGQQAVFAVERVSAAVPAAAAPGSSLQQAGAGVEAGRQGVAASCVALAATVTLRCKVRLLGPDEEAPDEKGVGASGGSALQGGEAEYAQAAAEAAAAAVGGGTEGPAAVAASRAAAAGAAGGGMEFNALGGLAGPKQALRELVALPLRAPQLFARYQVAPPRGILLYGPPGSGKTVLARAAAAAAGARLFVINGPDVVSEYFGESEAGLRGVFAAAKALGPSVVFIDELDAIAPSRGGTASRSSGSGGGGVAGRLVTALLTEMDTLEGSHVVLVAATNRPDAIDPALRRPGRFDREVEVGVPTPADRRDILRKRLGSMRHNLTEQQVEELADAAHGFVPADLGALCNEAALAALRRAQQMTPHTDASLCVTAADFAAAETRVRPSAMREVAVEVPNVKWEDVGGLEEVKQRLKEAVEWPFKNPAALGRLGAKAPKGVLLHGPPGCSKTLLARAVASQAKLNFLAIKGPELYNKYVGESEKAIATLFARARAASPSIVFFDELDGLATNRDDGGNGEGGVSVGERVLSQLLQEMDGLQARQNVIVVAATNRLDCIDPALTRPGRFDQILFVPPPDAQAREAIFRVHTRRMPLTPDVDLGALAARCLGYSGADVMALCREAALAALEGDIEANCVSMHDFLSAFGRIEPSFVAFS